MMKRVILPFGAALLVLAILYLAMGIDSSELPSPLVGKPAPEFELESLEDPDRSVTEEDFIGEVALVNVWASWCASCRAEKPHLVELARQGITIHAFNYRDERDDAHRYLNATGNPFDLIGHDPHGEAGMEWGVYATPETYVLDADGTIRHKHIGPLDSDVIRNKILPLIEKLEAEDA